MYYIKKNNDIVLYNADRQTLQNNLVFYPQYENLDIIYTEDEIITYNGKYYFKKDIEEQLVSKRRAEFNKEFFNTSLGYVRRKVTMKDGSHKDFLTDLLTPIITAVNGGQEVSVFTYDKPDFSEDVIDWVQYQHRVVATPQFLQECLQQISNDFFV